MPTYPIRHAGLALMLLDLWHPTPFATYPVGDRWYYASHGLSAANQGWDKDRIILGCYILSGIIKKSTNNESTKSNLAKLKSIKNLISLLVYPIKKRNKNLLYHK